MNQSVSPHLRVEMPSDYSLKQFEELCPPGFDSEKTPVLSHLTGRFIGSSARGCMISQHLSPDSGVSDSDLCERRQKCHGENMCVGSRQHWSALIYETIRKQ